MCDKKCAMSSVTVMINPFNLKVEKNRYKNIYLKMKNLKTCISFLA